MTSFCDYLVWGLGEKRGKKRKTVAHFALSSPDTSRRGGKKGEKGACGGTWQLPEKGFLTWRSTRKKKKKKKKKEGGSLP